jgi:hypothetical protein
VGEVIDLIERIAGSLRAPERSAARLGTVEKIDGSRVLRVRDFVPAKGGLVPAPGGLLLERRSVSKDSREWDRLIAEGGFRTNEDGWIGDGGLWIGRWPGWVAVLA